MLPAPAAGGTIPTYSRTLDGAIRQLATVGADRKIVLLSPGFTVEPRRVAERLDRALLSGITIDVVDARGCGLMRSTMPNRKGSRRYRVLR